MKKILLSLGMIVIVGALVVGASGALFRDTATSAINIFSAGQVSIELDGKNNNNSDVGTGAYFDLQNMMPGDKATAYVAVKNTSNEDLLIRGYVTEIANSARGGEKFSDKIRVTITINPQDITTNYTPRYEPQGANISYINYPDQSERSCWPSNILTGLIGAVVDEKIVHNFCMDNTHAFVNDAHIFRPNTYAVYKVDVELPKTTENIWQGAQFRGRLVFEAVQFDNVTSDDQIW
jgi:hypothetical protein